ncbi:tripartite tricarboxylate transporter TctB family protein [Leucobacter sp. M11]|uniref:tripartite tricarboxylate transporter TctB family protein n=1 Tax=Leucobacter sp. M11 TaxID=2993565 RepID=UPI002D7FF39A|nr:tripartite tricarboxylate transporter TctB family protein [Leucobacter sp. M11]MEB4615217.1 tripartite tricarboxylate transporter TctB family protein [Leucobacter sp. M11]
MSADDASPGAQPHPRWSAKLQTQIAQIAVAVIGVITVFLSAELRFWTAFGPGPGFFPGAMGVLLIGLAALWAVETKRRGFAIGESVHRSRVISILGSLIVLVVLMDVLGFQLSMALFLFFHLKILGKQSWVWTVGVTLIGSFGAFALFHSVLGVRLPTSSLAFLANLGL